MPVFFINVADFMIASIRFDGQIGSTVRFRVECDLTDPEVTLTSRTVQIMFSNCSIGEKVNE